MLQLTRSRLVCTETPDSLSSMRRTFGGQHVFRLPRFLAPDQSIHRENSYERDDEDIAREACMVDNPMLAMMCLIMNDTWSIANTGPGDAILFRIADPLVHRVTPVLGLVPRVVYAEWFQGRGDLLTLLKKTAEATDYAAESMQYTDPAAAT